MKKINLQIHDECGKALEIRTGGALPLREPRKLDIVGNIDSVFKFLAQRINEFDHKQAHIIVDREKFTIKLVIDETSFYSGNVKGVLTQPKDYEDFCINTGKEWDIYDLSDFIRLHKALFENRTQAAKLVAELQNFKLKIDGELQKSDDKRGNTEYVRRQTVKSNLPESFNLLVPLFKGFEKRTIKVEVDINPNTFDCTLISENAAEMIKDDVDAIIDIQIKNIETLCPDIVIIEI